jgi:indolepyruvate decarboxylase
LIRRLQDYGIRDAFGIPGDFALPTFRWLQQSKIQLINMTHEPSVGFAADAYARTRGLGLACVTYCVGGLNMLNSIAGAYAEKSPVIVISGGPSATDRRLDPLLHHKVKTFDTQRRIYEEVTCANTVLLDPSTAAAEIVRVIDAVVAQRRPGYIEVPYDIVDTPIQPFKPAKRIPVETDADSLAAALAETVDLINNAKHPVLLAGIELHRHKLTGLVLEIAESFNIPIAADLLSKSVVRENHPLYIGVYSGAMSEPGCSKYVDSSDCVIMLGTFMTDINLGIYTARLDPARSISATSEKLSIRYHTFEEVRFKDFIRGLVTADLKRRETSNRPHPEEEAEFKVRPGEKLTVKRLFQRLDAFLSDDTIVIVDVGDALFGAADLYIHQRTEFVGPAYYASMGFAVPAAIGAQLANPSLRPLVIVGDGAFQMTGMELTTALRQNLNPIVLVLNNAGYGTERQIHNGPYNDILPWEYSRIPEVLGGGRGYIASTEDELDRALLAARADFARMSIIDARLDPLDRSPALERLAERLSKKI